MRKPIIEVIPLKEYSHQTLEKEWRELFDKSAGCFFLSWNWIGSWLSILPDFEDKYVVRASTPISEQDIDSSSPNYEIVGFGIFCEKNVRRHGFVKSKQWHLHRTGDEKLDQIWIEYNEFLLAESGSSQEVNTDQLRQDIWHSLLTDQPNCESVDEFIIEVTKLSWADNFKSLLQKQKKSEHLFFQPDHGYKLSLFSSTNLIDYPKLISKSTFQHIKKTNKKLKSLGNLSFNKITDSKTIQSELYENSKWHKEKWCVSETPSGFENQYFNQFHSHLIDYCKNCTSLLPVVYKLSLDGSCLGILYGFEDAKSFYFYLSCIKPESNNQLKIGLLLHSLAVNLCSQQGLQYYDFLAGKADYKTKLTNQIVTLGKVIIQRSRIVFKIERLCSKIKSMFYLNNTLN